ncbi:MAG: serine hydrolase domain-containing protein [Candidatus Acidiferrales bacterium]
MKRHSLLFLAGALALSAILPSPGARAQSNDAAPPPADVPQELRMQIQKVMAAENIPGAGIALVDKDHIVWAIGLGKASLGENKDATADTCFRTGAISRSLVALALLKLQEDGKVNLEGKLSELAPELPVQNSWQSSHPINVADLLEQTAAFDALPERYNFNLSDPADISLPDILKKFAPLLAARWAPATRMADSDAGYGVAAYLIEKIVQQPFDRYVRENILAPLGATYSDFQLTDLNHHLLAEGYRKNSSKPVPLASFYVRAAEDFKSSAKELALLVQMFLNRGQVGKTQLFRPESILRMEYPETTSAARAGLKYGYGLGNYADFSGPVVAHGQSGRVEGFSSSYRYLPDQGMGWVILLNTSTPGDGLEQIDLLLMNQALAGQSVSQAAPVMLGPADLEKFSGYYEQRNPREERLKFLDLLWNGRRITQEYGTLYQKKFFGANRVLVPVSANQFRLDKEQAASRIFFTGDNGEMIYADQLFYGVRTADSLWPITRLALVLLAAALMASSVVYVLVWIPLKLTGRAGSERYLPRLMEPALATLSLFAAWLIFHFTPSWLLGAYDILTAAIWFLTWVFAIFSVWSLILALQSFRWNVHPVLRIYSVLVAGACCGMAAYLGYWHVIGLKLWVVL